MPSLSFADFFKDRPPAGDVDIALPPPPFETPLPFLDAVGFALGNHPDVLVARHAPERARAGVDAAYAVYDPEAFADWTRAEDHDRRQSFTAYYNRRALANTERAGLRQRLPTGMEVTAYREWVDGSETGGGHPKDRVDGAANVVKARQPLLYGIRDRENLATIRVARLEVKAADEEFRQAMADAVAQTARAYWQFAGAREEIRVARRVLAQAVDVLERAKTRHGEGLLMALDVKRAREAVAARKADLIRAEEQYAVSREQLALFLGADGDCPDTLAPSEPLTVPPLTVDIEAAVAQGAGEPARNQGGRIPGG